jgi:hypothetical protein
LPLDYLLVLWVRQKCMLNLRIDIPSMGASHRT